MARAAIDEFTAEHGKDLQPGDLVGVRLLEDGEDLSDPLAANPDDELAEYEAMQERIRSYEQQAAELTGQTPTT